MQTSPRPPSSKGNPKLRGRPWDVDRIRQVLSGSADPTLLTGIDRKGLSAAQFALLRTAATADDLRQLLALLDPPDENEQTQLDQILGLLETIAEGQLRVEAQLAVLGSAVAGLRASSPQPPHPGRTASKG